MYIFRLYVVVGVGSTIQLNRAKINEKSFLNRFQILKNQEKLFEISFGRSFRTGSLPGRVPPFGGVAKCLFMRKRSAFVTLGGILKITKGSKTAWRKQSRHRDSLKTVPGSGFEQNWFHNEINAFARF